MIKIQEKLYSCTIATLAILNHGPTWVGLMVGLTVTLLCCRGFPMGCPSHGNAHASAARSVVSIPLACDVSPRRSDQCERAHRCFRPPPRGRCRWRRCSPRFRHVFARTEMACQSSPSLTRYWSERCLCRRPRGAPRPRPRGRCRGHSTDPEAVRNGDTGAQAAATRAVPVSDRRSARRDRRRMVLRSLGAKPQR